MAYPSEHYGMRSNGASRVILVLVAMFLVFYIVGPQLNLDERSSSPQVLCTCDCDCSEELLALPLPLDFSNGSHADCGKHDPDMHEEMEKNFVELLSEEITLQGVVANETLGHTKALTMDARKTSSLYQKEAEKCNAGMETCEEAREKAEAELIVERRLTALWEQRARELGWRDSRKVYV